MAQEIDVASGRLAHFAQDFGGHDQPQDVVAGAQPTTRRPALALTAEGPRRADLIEWAGTHHATLTTMCLLAPAGIGTLLAHHVGLSAEPLRSGTLSPAVTVGLAAAGDIDAMVAFTDPIELRPGDNTTRALTRLAVFWDIPIASNRATADLLLASLTSTDGPANRVAEAAEAAVLEPVRGAVKLWNIRATVDDVPGRLAVLTTSLARRAINILSVQVHLTPDGPVDELLVGASVLLSAADLCAAVVDGGARTPQVTPADAHALVDAPTRALSLATRLVRSPDDLAGVLTSLMPGAALVWRAEAPDGQEDDSTRLWLAEPAGGGFLLSRPTTPFTPAERARAFAMVDIAIQAQVRPQAEPAAESWLAVLTDGTEVTMRPASPDDLARVVELHNRCALTTRLRRYFSGTRCPSPAMLERLLSPASGRGLVVEDAAGRIVAMGNLTWPSASASEPARDAESGPAVIPELAILVEDVWQQRRLGTLLARRLLTMAEQLGVVRIQAVMHASNAAMTRIMVALCEEPGRRLHREYDGGMLTLIVGIRSDLSSRSVTPA